MNNKKKIMYIGILLIITVIVSITYFSYAFLTQTDVQHGKMNIVVGTLEYQLKIDNVETNTVIVPANDTKEIEVKVKSLNTISSKFELYYLNIENVEVGYIEDNSLPTGTLEENEEVTITVILTNNSSSNKEVTLGIQGSLINNDIELASNMNSIEVADTAELCNIPVGTVYNFAYTGSAQTFTPQCTGKYKLEVWGAQGGNYTYGVTVQGGNGGYSTGIKNLDENDQLYIYVGGQGASPVYNGSAAAAGGYNGGGTGGNIIVYSQYSWIVGGAGGGGATDIRYGGNTLNNRLIVAGGGGGAGANSGSSVKQYNIGGAGGGTTGGNGTGTMAANYSGIRYGMGATQNGPGCASGLDTWCGALGTGGTNGYTGSAVQAGGGGGGYYGGGAGVNYGASGGGGSGYIDGVDNGQTITGNQDIIEPDGTTATGHIGNGYARITYLGNGGTAPGTSWVFDYTGDVQEFNVPKTGVYKLETWGAEGGTYNSTYVGGKGAYSSGEIELINNEKIYLYIGESGRCINENTSNFNGGSIVEQSVAGYTYTPCLGGGSTDIRLANGNWDNFDSLKSRIMVSAGGGGAYYYYKETTYYGSGGDAGGLNGYTGTTKTSQFPAGTGGTQTSGGTYNGKFGIGGSPGYYAGSNNGGVTSSYSSGGNGYYSGGASHHVSGSGSGSSFISGYSGCNAIAESSTSSSITHTNQPNHYSGKVFNNGVMIDGKGCNWSTGSATNCGTNQPQPDGTMTAGHSDNGYAKITYLGQHKTIKFNVQGGDSSIADINVLENTAIGTLPTPTKEGYFFKGWYRDEEFTMPVDSTYVVTGNMTLYAKWAEAVYIIKNGVLQDGWSLRAENRGSTSLTVRQETDRLAFVPGSLNPWVVWPGQQLMPILDLSQYNTIYIDGYKTATCQHNSTRQFLSESSGTVLAHVSTNPLYFPELPTNTRGTISMDVSNVTNQMYLHIPANYPSATTYIYNLWIE